MEGIGQLQDAFVVLFFLQLFDFVDDLLVGVLVNGLAIVPRFQLKLLRHATRQRYYYYCSMGPFINSFPAQTIRTSRHTGEP